MEVKKEHIILPAPIIELILAAREQKREIHITEEMIFPPGYMEYLEKVLNSNRHLPLFSYPYVEEDPIGEAGLWIIARHQIEQLMIMDQ